MLTTPDSPIMFMAFCKKKDHTHNSHLDQKSTLTKAMGQGPKLLIKVKELILIASLTCKKASSM